MKSKRDFDRIPSETKKKCELRGLKSKSTTQQTKKKRRDKLYAVAIFE